MKKLMWIMVVAMMVIASAAFAGGIKEERMKSGTAGDGIKPAYSSQDLGPGGVYKVNFLFEIDGYRVYRFVDADRIHYLVLPTGERGSTAQTLNQQPYTSGKTTIYRPDDIVTVLKALN
jgi:hypothetical protein